MFPKKIILILSENIQKINTVKLIITFISLFWPGLSKIFWPIAGRLTVKNPILTSTKTNIYIKTTNSFKTDITHFRFTKKMEG